jgi:hypothetical protein
MMHTYEIFYYGREKPEQVNLIGEGLLLAFLEYGQSQNGHGVWVGELGRGGKVAINLSQIQFLQLKPRQGQ